MNGQAVTLAQRPSPTPSLSTASLKSQDGKPTHQTPSIPEEPVAAPAPAGLAVPTPATKKPTLTHRLTRMFSQAKVSKESDGSQAGSASDSEGVTANGNGTVSGNASTIQPKTPSRRQSQSDRGQRPSSATGSDRRMSSVNVPKSQKDGDAALTQYKRFELLPDGEHQHTLKSARRQEKLSGMLRDMLGGKKKEDQAPDDPQQLSLMSTWVDQLRSERERLASDKKGRP